MLLNFAHRGFSGKFPENTMLAFEKGAESGCDGIELDVQLSSDGIPVIIHDESLRRTADVSGSVWDYSFRELKKLDVSGRYREKCGSCEIPSLEEYLEFASGTSLITNIELKTGVNPYPGIEDKVLELVARFRLDHQVIISSFNHYSVLRTKKAAPQIPCGLLEESQVIGAAEYAGRLGVEFLHPVSFAVTEAYMEEARAYGIGVHVWTVNTEVELRRLKALGVRGVIGDYPDLAAGVL